MNDNSACVCVWYKNISPFLSVTVRGVTVLLPLYHHSDTVTLFQPGFCAAAFAATSLRNTHILQMTFSHADVTGSPRHIRPFLLNTAVFNNRFFSFPPPFLLQEMTGSKCNLT